MPKIFIVIFLVAVIPVACALPVVVGILAARRLKRTNPNSEFVKPLQPPAVLSATLSVLGLLLLTITRGLFPNSALGSLLHTPAEFIAASIVWLVVWSIVGEVLFKPKGKDGV